MVASKLLLSASKKLKYNQQSAEKNPQKRGVFAECFEKMQ